MNRVFRRKCRKLKQSSDILTATHFTDYHIKILNSLHVELRGQYIDKLDDALIDLMYTIEEFDTENNNMYDNIINIYQGMLIDKDYQTILYNEYNQICNICENTGQSLHDYLTNVLYPDVNTYISNEKEPSSIKTKLLRIVDSKLSDVIYQYSSGYMINCITNINTYLNNVSDQINKHYVSNLKQSDFFIYISQFSYSLKCKISKELVKRKKSDISNRQHFLVLYAEQLLLEHINGILEYALFTMFNMTLDFLHLYHSEQDTQEIAELINYNFHIPIKYIDKYLDLNKLANDSGYNLIRCHGDHGIFENNDGHVVVIPQGRTIGKGLSITIQKELQQE